MQSNDQNFKNKLIQEIENLSKDELNFISNNGGFEKAFKILENLKENLSNPNFIIKTVTSEPIAAIMFFSAKIKIYSFYGFEKDFVEIAKSHPMAAKSLFSRSHIVGSLFKNHYSFLIGILASHIETAEFIFSSEENTKLFFYHIPKKEHDFALAQIGKASIEHAKIVLNKFRDKFKDPQPLSEMAQESPEIAKLILQDDEFLKLLTQPSNSMTDLSNIAPSNIETAKWIFSVPYIVKKLTKEDLEYMFENDGTYGVNGEEIKNIYLKSKEHDQIRKVARLLAQGKRSEDCLFNKLPNELNHKIAALCKTTNFVKEEESIKIASKHFIGIDEESIQNILYKWENKKVNEINSNEFLQRESLMFGFVCKNLQKNGNCLFEAVLDQLKNTFTNEQYTQKDLSIRAIQCLITNRKYYESFIIDQPFNIFIQKMATTGTWGEHVVLNALCHSLNISVVIINSDGTDPIILKKNNSIATIYLGYEVDLHYQSLQKNEQIKEPQRNIQYYIEKADVLKELSDFPPPKSSPSEEKKEEISNISDKDNIETDLEIDEFDLKDLDDKNEEHSEQEKGENYSDDNIQKSSVTIAPKSTHFRSSTDIGTVIPTELSKETKQNEINQTYMNAPK